MHWTVISPMMHSKELVWLNRFLPKESIHRLEALPIPRPTDRTADTTSLSTWLNFLKYGRRGWSDAVAHARAGRSGIIAQFPQLATSVALWKMLSRRRDIPVVAWHFNLGKMPSPAARTVLNRLLSHIDCFVVHSRHEAKVYAEWLSLPLERFEFVPVAAPARPPTDAEETEAPFLLAMGSAKRDYATLFASMQRLPLRAIVVAPAHAVAGLAVPPNVQVMSNLSAEACYRLLQRCRLHLLPIANSETASGHVTLVDAMLYGKATIATRSLGLDDYATDGSEIVYLPPFDVDAMVAAIDRLWHDDEERARLGRQAKHRAFSEFSDPVQGLTLQRLLDDRQAAMGRR